jgi:hypothetical protein
MYADDIKLYREVRSYQDVSLSQQDLDNLTEWIDLNVEKCATLTLTRSKKRIKSIYYIEGEAFAKEDQMRDLGVLLQPTLNYKQYVNAISAKAKLNLEMIIRNTKHFRSIHSIRTLFYSFVRSNLENGVVTLAPQL